eukprot:2167595-Pleurochrysis_carterae.AAC.1
MQTSSHFVSLHLSTCASAAAPARQQGAVCLSCINCASTLKRMRGDCCRVAGRSEAVQRDEARKGAESSAGKRT